MRRDKDEFLLVVMAHSGDVAMLLLTAKGELFINELAREKLRAIWHPKKVYESNITQLLPRATSLRSFWRQRRWVASTLKPHPFRF